MTNITNPEFEKNIVRDGGGKFDGWKGSEPEIPPLTATVYDVLPISRDFTDTIKSEGSVVTGQDDTPDVYEVLHSAERVEIVRDTDGSYRADATFSDIDMVQFAIRTLELDEEAGTDEAVAWLNANHAVIKEFLAERDMEDLSEYEWDASSIVVGATITDFPDGEVTFSAAKDALGADRNVQYLAEGLTDPDAAFPADLARRLQQAGYDKDGNMSFGRMDDLFGIIFDPGNGPVQLDFRNEALDFVRKEINPNLSDTEAARYLWTVYDTPDFEGDYDDEGELVVAEEDRTYLPTPVSHGLAPVPVDVSYYIATRKPWTGDEPDVFWD